ncbi:MAG: PaaI family thioesterase [Alphaproteobacteria bacterium]|jgi:uncharacterized protein (TIGR00369 family)|nr:PaaI family thioesterase [Alphaproteobacteria bacterium]MBT4085278.1 PaaI family thioesterase [Alphaproteobacteria bacterium]MBT4544195.1 PaaI family thioesterase [Alphaproteobacteria bacterium]MBT7747421.1 PaaI family thioesterase [Alphaproteobacteria bacterium]
MTLQIPDGYAEIVMENPFLDLVGPIYGRDNEGRIEVGLYADDRHKNPGGVIHGGLLMTLVDNLMGATIHHTVGPRYAATVSLNCDFLSATKPGEWISGIGEVTRHTSSMVFIRGLLKADDRPIMTAAGVFKLLDNPSSRNNR